MENQHQLQEEEVVNLQQFQVGRNPEEHENLTANEDNGYTPGETQFADGEGTRLDEESEEPETDPETEDFDEEDDAAEESDEDADFENPDDDPA